MPKLVQLYAGAAGCGVGLGLENKDWPFGQRNNSASSKANTEHGRQVSAHFHRPPKRGSENSVPGPHVSQAPTSFLSTLKTGVCGFALFSSQKGVLCQSGAKMALWDHVLLSV